MHAFSFDLCSHVLGRRGIRQAKWRSSDELTHTASLDYLNYGNIKQRLDSSDDVLPPCGHPATLQDFLGSVQDILLPCWKSVRPQPLISKASPVKTMLRSFITSDTQPSVCPGVSNTVKNYRGNRFKLFVNFVNVWYTETNSMHEMRNLFILRVSQRLSCHSPTGGYLQSLCWIWRWRSSAPPALSSSTLCWWCGQRGSGCWLSQGKQKKPGWNVVQN